MIKTRELICHTDCFMINEEDTKEMQVLTMGVVYEVKEETASAFIIEDDLGYEHYFTKHEDNYGTSYADWLNVLQEDEE